MSLAILKDGLRTGIGSLDYEHRELVGMIEKLCDSFERASSAHEVSDWFGALYAQASAHFALEESLMREKKYAFYDAHKADHERLLDKIRFMMDAYEDDLCTDCGVSLRECLHDWLASHVRNEDARLGDLVE